MCLVKSKLLMLRKFAWDELQRG